MARFSERIGAVEVPKVLQTEGMTNALRNTIWNFIVSLFGEGESGWFAASRHVAQFLLKVPVDDLPPHNFRCREWLKQQVYAMKWYAVYDLVELVCDNYTTLREYTNWNKGRLQEVFNKIFEEELSGYRFIAGQLVPIASPAETAAIEAAVEISSRLGLAGAHTHIVTALQLLAKRPNPDYRNSVKESISAVESMAKQLGTAESQGLASALDELAKKVPMHGALRSAFVKLYGYSSDESGVRHAILDEPNVGYDEAKYMAVTCSAFVNYIAAKAETAGLLKVR